MQSEFKYFGNLEGAMNPARNWLVKRSGVMAFSVAAVAMLAMIITQIVAILIPDTNPNALAILGVEWVITIVWAVGLFLSSRSVLAYSKDIFGVLGVAVTILQPIVGSTIPYFHSFSEMAELLSEFS